MIDKRDIRQVLIWLLGMSSTLIKMLVLSVILFYFWADILVNAYIDISTQVCNEYSNITKKEVKYFDVVGCFEKTDNSWIKIY